MEQKNVIMIVLTTMLSASVTGIILLCCKLVCMERLYEDLNRENAVLNHELHIRSLRSLRLSHGISMSRSGKVLPPRSTSEVFAFRRMLPLEGIYTLLYIAENF